MRISMIIITNNNLRLILFVCSNPLKSNVKQKNYVTDKLHVGLSDTEYGFSFLLTIVRGLLGCI